MIGIDELAHVVDDGSHVAPRHVAHHDHLPLDLLAVDDVRPGFTAHFCDRAERDLCAAGSIDEHVIQILGPAGAVFRHLHDEVEGVLAFQHARYCDALQGRFECLRHVTNDQTVPCHLLAVEMNVHDGNLQLLLERQINHAWNCGHRFARLFAERAKLAEVRAEDFHRHVGACAGEHVIDAVRNRLTDRDVHAGN